ncbi:unnamed protein product [marine sediment metagenome]|uniref:Uncharacterized protein n=1 Tax=marine sediment metagenome TaxID=412755 RepID=X1PZQ4_9ZZZZ
MILPGSWLTLRAEVGASVADNYPLNGGAAGWTGLTAQAVGNLKLEVSRA